MPLLPHLLPLLLVLTISREADSKCTGGDTCCSVFSRCGIREGDCDWDAECSGNLKCGDNNCVQCTSTVQYKSMATGYIGTKCADRSGFEWDDDCCFDPGVPSIVTDIFLRHHLNLWWSAKNCNGKDDGCCTKDKPCREGWGDCDSDDQCAGDLKCGRDNCRFELH